MQRQIIHVYNHLYKQTAWALYFQRSGKLEAPHAESCQRGGLLATTAEIHASHAPSSLKDASNFPVGTNIPRTKGWLDAGDYGRYVYKAASALFILFTALELYSQKFPDNYYNISEGGNNIPDSLHSRARSL
ncbi:glycoside hydrolase family 9 protein [Dyadobacter psychrophilus]|uniref:glycoside hydrolase family 9 protein n=1 Tax=Dyadobacter psychrophilus TaxID=651661 RepID=UPI001E2938E1|nr:glycoside hydrolase family 9 protein [Dyadobacter psychrophilus]